MKAVGRQRQLFRSSPPCQPPFAPQQECGRVCVCDLPSLPLERPACRWCQPTAPPECRLRFQCQGAHPALPACMSARLKSPRRWRCCPASCWANEKPLWQLSWLAGLPQNPGCQLSTVSGLITSADYACKYSSIYDDALHTILHCRDT